MNFDAQLWLVNSILASSVTTFQSPYGPRNNDVVQILGCADILACVKTV